MTLFSICIYILYISFSPANVEHLEKKRFYTIDHLQANISSKLMFAKITKSKIKSYKVESQKDHF